MKDVDEFKTWLTDRGAEILAPTNPYEVLRFRSSRSVSVIYQNNKGRRSFTGEASDAFDAFKAGRKWTAGFNRRRYYGGEKARLIETLLARDGNECCLCGRPMPDDDMTVEHIVPIGAGGTNHQNNLGLAHEQCNRKAGHMNAVAKMRLRDELRSAQP
ncbi:HNH endonuclease [Marinibaculum pumilum]|uniref:HNH endonuclease n=1 Tax=Marinibaculum pumilum TaxID=1766165 RepID=A0ABV7KYG6_9PROT